ncbi:choline transport protein [Poronia punctata]|nr:choline transport protein [Poronia punctata]
MPHHHEPSPGVATDGTGSEKPPTSEKHTSNSGGSLQEGQITTHQTQKPFTTLSAIGIGYGVTNTAVGVPLILSTALPLGGTPLVFWGFLLMAAVGLATATTLAELISAMPHPGGQYVWVNKLAPERYRRGLSYTTAMVSWIAAIAIGSSGNLSVPVNAFAIISLFHPDFVYKRWMGFVAFQIINIITCFGACFENILPRLSKLLLLVNVLSVGAIIITLFAMSTYRTPDPNAASDTFFGITNISGWPDGVAFIIGLNGANWLFSCLDVATHLAEEIPSPATNIPKALIWTIVVGTVTGTLMCLAIVINLPPTPPPDSSYTGTEIFYRITDSKPATIALWTPVLFLVTASVWAVQTWQSRLAWTISRESGFPFHARFSKIYPAPFHTPIWSLVGSAAGIALFGFLYLASELAFNSLIATGILLQYTSYSIPTILLLWKGRKNFGSVGPFWNPWGLGMLANLVMLAWTGTAFVFYCFPVKRDPNVGEVNYVSAVLVLVGVFVASLWFCYAKGHYEVVEDVVVTD